MTDETEGGIVSDDFDPDMWMTWPIPEHGVLSRWENGRPRRLTEWGYGWVDGFDMALRMAHDFHATGEWHDVA